MKISHFPDFLPDETVYSVASRYMDRMQFPSHSVISHHFFGGRDRGFVTDLPTNLEHLVQSLSCNHVYTADSIIDNHTLFSFYAPFLPPERMLPLRDQMKNNGYNYIYSIAGVLANNVLRPKWLKYCPACVDHDRLTYGECYWHRVHQVPGVLVCPLHEIMLEDSTVNFLRGNTKPKFYAAENTVVNFPQRTIPLQFHQFLVQLARNAKWLLEHWMPSELWSMKREYFLRLTNIGFFTAAGLMRYAKLKAAISNYYPEGLLELLECTTARSNEIWFETWTHIRHPLHRLLLIQFLCETAEEFFTKSQTATNLFGNGPWPCLNPLCSHYKERVITSYLAKQGGPGQPVGTFLCNCGYAYTRTGPDKDENAIFRGRASQYGVIWDQYLTTYWLDQNIPIGRIARLMHTDFDSIRRQAARLNLPFAPDLPCRGVRPFIIQDQINEKRPVYRALWGEALESNPHGNLNDVIKTTKKTYSWLKRNDQDWLKEHHPALPSRSNNKRLLKSIEQIQQNHYSQIDADLAKAVRQAAEEIYTKLNFPTQVTRRILIGQIGEVALTKRSDVTLNNLPIASQAIKEVLETDIAYIWRKLRWAVQSLLTEETYPAFYMFLRRARISSLASQHPLYKKIIQFAYKSLQDGYTLSEQIPESLSVLGLPSVTPSSNSLLKEPAFGSLALAFIDRNLDLQKPLKREKERSYELYHILLLIVAAVVSGADTHGAIALWGYRNENLLMMFGFPQRQLPCTATLKRLWKNVYIESFESILEIWLHSNFPEIKVSDTAINEQNNFLPGMQLLRAYRCIASAVIARLH